MWKHLLVPLDGTPMAEAALPLAAYLSERLGARVTLLHILERHAPPQVHGARHLAGLEEARQYLEGVAQRSFPHGAPVIVHVHETPLAAVAGGIKEHVEELAPQLVVMCTHGPAGLLGALFGSQAQRVFAGGVTPVLLARPGVEGQAVALRKFCVPDDGTSSHEPGLAVVAELARACGAAVLLAMAVETPATLAGAMAAAGTLLPGAAREMLEVAQDEGLKHLEAHARELRGEGLTVTTEVRRGEPVETLAAAAAACGADLLAIRTHGKMGTAAFWANSLAPRLAARFQGHVLLIPTRAGDE